MKSFFANVVALPDSGRDATTAFTSGTGDVLLSYENEAILARQSGTDFDYVIPDSTLLIENPCALTEGASDCRQGFLDFQKSEDGQKLYAETGYRPLVDVGDVEVEGANDAERPVPGRRRRCSPSTTTSVAGARPTTSTSVMAKRATRSASSPSSRRIRASSGHRSRSGRPAGAQAPVGSRPVDGSL